MQSQATAREVYDDRFFDYADRASAGSAQRIVPLVQSLFPGLRSVADFGCARGVWLSIWKECGVGDICGIDGDYVDLTKLQIPAGNFVTHDLTRPLDLKRRFDIVQSLEVAEHLPERAARTFVETLSSHGDMVLFSAAPPGQGGAHHVNEQLYEYWRDLFAERGFDLFDCIRPAISRDVELQYWYRFNSFVYIHERATDRLTGAVRRTAIPRGHPIPDVSPLPFRMRKAIVSLLPAEVQNGISAVVGRWRARG